MSEDVVSVADRPQPVTPTDPRRARQWRLVRRAAIALAAAICVAWILLDGLVIGYTTPILFVALFFGLASIGRSRAEVLRNAGDAALFAVLWLAYAETRGLADRIGFPIQVESVRNIDRVLFLGLDPTVELQERFLGPPGDATWYDVIGSTVYFTHFIVTPVTLVVLWLVERREWVRYMQRLATVLGLACLTFIVLPTAPPWMAGDPDYGYEALPELRRPTGNGWREIGLDAFVEPWDVGRDWANPVAAMPSLHAALSLIFTLSAMRWLAPRRWRYALLAYPVAMMVALVYFGEHYVADALAGFLLVIAAFWFWVRRDRRRAAADAAAADPAAATPVSG